MFRSSHTIGKFLIVFIFIALSLGSAGLATPASAAQPPAPKSLDTTGVFRLKVIYPATICVGNNIIKVTPIIVSEVNGHGNGPGGLPIGGILIKAEITDNSIATISPASQTSPAIPVRTDAVIEPGSGQVAFTITGKKAGSTNLFLTAQVPKRWAGGKTMYFGPSGMPTGGPIKVVNCKYKVQIYYSMLGLFLQGASATVMGYMQTILEGDGEYYHGADVLETLESRSLPGCSSSHTGFKSPTTITGKLTDEKLELTIKYEPGQYTATITCAGRTNTSSKSEDPTGWLQSGGTFPETGGSLSKRLDFAGFLGTATITVTPVTNSAP